MRVKDGFVMREVAGQAMVIATGEASKEFHGMIKLNDTGKTIWEELMRGTTKEKIVKKLSEVYEIDEKQAEQDTEIFIEKMQKAGFLA